MAQVCSCRLSKRSVLCVPSIFLQVNKQAEIETLPNEGPEVFVDQGRCWIFLRDHSLLIDGPIFSIQKWHQKWL
jgi:hypothetical protein